MKNILVVEDNVANMYLIDFILNHAGYRVLQADTGEKAVELALREKPDLILMDIQLPGIDGLAATGRIRKSEGGQSMTIVALTSFAMTGDKERALAAGCNGYLEKPINPETFLEDIKRYL
ncbi:MAG TPA: response regulator [Gallionella sp.]|nr:response regulator [Gallionella sp.]